MLNIPEFTVTEFARAMKRVVEDSFGYVRIKGEISGFKKASSGHLYFSLKDEEALLSGICFKNVADSVGFEIADGLQIIASGRITTYAGRSNYQIIVEKIEIAGIGAILEMIEKRRQKLQAEGLFDAIHKKSLPFFPKTIAVITSPTGAVIQDIIHRVEARCPTHLMLYPSSVQGKDAAKNVISGIKFFCKLKEPLRPALIIIARGGGSFEDLLPFNDEELVREIFKCDIPIISAVGHETDTTLIDYVADLRAPTPTAAAEIATPILNDLKNQLNYLEQKIKLNSQNLILKQNEKLEKLQKYLINPRQILLRIEERYHLNSEKLKLFSYNIFEKKLQKLNSIQLSAQVILFKYNLAQQKIDNAFKQVKSMIDNKIKQNETALKNLEKLLKLGHYQEILKRGFALIKNQKGQLISKIEAVKSKEEITIEILDGEFSAYVLESKNNSKTKQNSQDLDIIQPKLL